MYVYEPLYVGIDNDVDIDDLPETEAQKLTQKMKKRFDCKDQLCWMGSKVVKQTKDDDILKNTFRPNGPKKQFEWLSTKDIEDVMKQYEYKHKDFKFLGAMPSDFDELRAKTNKIIDVIVIDKEKQIPVRKKTTINYVFKNVKILSIIYLTPDFNVY